MNLQSVTLAALALLSATSAHAADDASLGRPYLRILATAVELTEDLADSGAGVLLELGREPQPGSDWEAAFTTGWIAWDQEESFEDLTGEVEMELLPALLSVRYRVPLGRASLALGPALGVTHSRLGARAFEDGELLGSFSHNRWNFTWGGELVLSVPIGERLHVCAGYKFLSTNAGAITVEDVRIDLGDIDTHVFSAGLGWSW